MSKKQWLVLYDDGQYTECATEEEARMEVKDIIDDGNYVDDIKVVKVDAMFKVESSVKFIEVSLKKGNN